jgi:hypothetical protein
MLYRLSFDYQDKQLVFDLQLIRLNRAVMMHSASPVLVGPFSASILNVVGWIRVKVALLKSDMFLVQLDTVNNSFNQQLLVDLHID